MPRSKLIRYADVDLLVLCLAPLDSVTIMEHISRKMQPYYTRLISSHSKFAKLLDVLLSRAQFEAEREFEDKLVPPRNTTDRIPEVASFSELLFQLFSRHHTLMQLLLTK